MTYFEAQQIIDNLDSKTVIDANWLDYLLEEKELITLQALQLVTEKTWKDLLDKYEGQEISIFQTEVIENYVGKTLHFIEHKIFYLIISQDYNHIYFYDGNSIVPFNISDLLESKYYKII